MAKKMKFGIQNNRVRPTLGNFPESFRMDMRTTKEVDETRDPTNNKPYRNKQQKAQAVDSAVKQKTGRWKGTYVSHTPCSSHPSRLDVHGYPTGSSR